MKFRVLAAALAMAVGFVAVPAQAQVIGPDAYGYTLTRTANADAASSGYVTINGVGGTVQLNTTGTTADDVTYTQTPSFSFNFYGTSYSQMFVSTNGFIAFGGNTGSATGGSYLNPNLALANITSTGGTGAPTIPRAVAAPFWDDLYLAGAQPGKLLTANRNVAGVDEFVVEYNGVQFFDAQTTPLTIQAVFRANGTMSWYYPDVTSASAGTGGASASIGIQDLNGGAAANRYLSWSFNQPNAISNFDRIDIAPVPEPTSMALCGLAIGGAGLRAWKKRKAAKA